MIKLFILQTIVPAMLLWGCSNYSFTGASLSPEIQTVSFGNFPNRSDNPSARLSEVFRNTLEDKFLSGTNLSVVDDNGDISFEGAIVRYDVSPVAVQQDRASQNRLTIGVNIRFENSMDDEKNFEIRFEEYEEFDAGVSLSSIEDDLITEICRKMADDIFNRAVIDW